MLGEQVAVFDKCDLCFNTQNDLNHKLKNILKANYNSKFVCNYCNQNGHLRHSCRIKKSVYFGGKTMWIPKTNNKGPFIKWVPKTES